LGGLHRDHHVQAGWLALAGLPDIEGQKLAILRRALASRPVRLGRLMRHERTILYQRCLRLMQITAELIEQLPAGFAFLIEQLRKSSSSVARNYGEGYYQRCRAQQRKYVDIASHSARETAMSFDTAQCFRIADSTTIARGKQAALELVKMLSKFRHG
jgi:four helix bundle protein